MVVLLNVRPMPVVYPASVDVPVDFSGYTAQLEQQNREASHRILKKAAGYLKPKKFALKAISLSGDARDEITRKVEEIHADLLIVGSRGMGVVRRAFVGSTSDHLVHHVRCAVIVVKEPFKNKTLEPPVAGSKKAEQEVGLDVDPVPA
jgi:nucleotide-binding universal stress UspA family protein